MNKPIVPTSSSKPHVSQFLAEWHRSPHSVYDLVCAVDATIDSIPAQPGTNILGLALHIHGHPVAIVLNESIVDTQLEPLVIAHEVAHIIEEDIGVGLCQPGSDTLAEYRAWRTAARLIIPAAHADEVIARRATIVEVAAEHDVPIAFATMRVRMRRIKTGHRTNYTMASIVHSWILDLQRSIMARHM